ncbi:MAG: glycosyltransferase [Chloroflexota bacterium]|nr:glycosyltransferase [Chloroflexota bacterium]
MKTHNPEKSTNKATVILYTDQSDNFPEYRPVRKLSEVHSDTPLSVSLISTVKNEIDSIPIWFESIIHGSRLPEEIVIVDAGSDDGTLGTLKELLSGCSIPFSLLSEPGINIAQGRNIAISKAQHSIIACTDFGGYPRTDWLDRLIKPFEDNREIEVAAGWYEAVDRNGQPFPRRRWPTLEQVNPDDFIPSSRSIAFKKSAWVAAGGYPEWLTMTGEDTCFAVELKKVTRLWAFVPDAVVEWHAPDEIRSYWRKQYQWSVGDGEAGLNTAYYRSNVIQISIIFFGTFTALMLVFFGISSQSFLSAALGLIIAAVLMLIIITRTQRAGQGSGDIPWEIGAKFAQMLGFIRGYFNRVKIVQRNNRQK